MIQEVPSQCSAMGCSTSWVNPTDQTSEGAISATPARAVRGAGLGAGTSLHAEPFQCWTTTCSWPDPPELPTAHASELDEAATPDSWSEPNCGFRIRLQLPSQPARAVGRAEPNEGGPEPTANATASAASAGTRSAGLALDLERFDIRRTSS